MPQLLGLLLIGAGAVAGFQAVRRVLGGLAGAESGSETSASSDLAMKDIGTLELDPESGIYKPKKPN